MHYIANIEIVDPIIELFESERVPNSNFEFLDLLNSLNLFQITKANVQLVPLSHEVFLAIASIQLNVSLFESYFPQC